MRAFMAPQPPAEVTGLVALMLLHDARRDARIDDKGDIVVLEERIAAPGIMSRSSKRCRWSRSRSAVDRVPLRFRPRSRRCTAGRRELKIRIGRKSVRLYDLLERIQPSPIVALNRAVAVAMVAGPHAGLAIIDALSDRYLDGYHLLHAARADLSRRCGMNNEAAKS